MGRRGINRSDITRLIRNLAQVLPSIKGRRIYQSLIGRMRRVLPQVIAKEDAIAYHVVTAYKTTQIAKYWRNP
jgi:hypothetical protein